MYCVHSVEATIQFHRPDLPLPLTNTKSVNDVIPLNPPFNFFLGKDLFLEIFLKARLSYINNYIFVDGVFGVGELMLASFPPHNFFNSSDYDHNSWYFSPYSELISTQKERATKQ